MLPSKRNFFNFFRRLIRTSQLWKPPKNVPPFRWNPSGSYSRNRNEIIFINKFIISEEIQVTFATYDSWVALSWIGFDKKIIVFIYFWRNTCQTSQNIFFFKMFFFASPNHNEYHYHSFIVIRFIRYTKKTSLLRKILFFIVIIWLGLSVSCSLSIPKWSLRLYFVYG